MKPWGLCVVYLYIALFIVSILTPVSSSYKRTICFIPNAYMHMPWPLWERQMHIGQTCQTTSSWADGQPSKHKHFQRLWRSCVSVKRSCIQTHAQLHIWTASITHYQTGAGSYFCPLNDPTTNVPPPTVFPTHSNTETRMKCVGEMKKRWQDIKRVEHKTGTGGRLSSLTIQILSRTASHALTYAWWPHHALAVLQTPRAWSKHMNLNSLLARRRGWICPFLHPSCSSFPRTRTSDVTCLFLVMFPQVSPRWLQHELPNDASHSHQLPPWQLPRLPHVLRWPHWYI